VYACYITAPVQLNHTLVGAVIPSVMVVKGQYVMAGQSAECCRIFFMQGHGQGSAVQK
jgi:hypothetical protein